MTNDFGPEASRAPCFFRSPAFPSEICGNRLIDMAIEHRLMHAETLAYALHWLPVELKRAQSEPDPLFDFYRWDPTPVGAYPAGRSAFGAFDLLGNGWEWTSTRFAPFPGFEPNPGYPGYSAEFFDGRHHVLKGGSPRTDAALLRRSFRNWFLPHYPYLYAGFRLAAP